MAVLVGRHAVSKCRGYLVEGGIGVQIDKFAGQSFGCEQGAAWFRREQGRQFAGVLRGIVDARQQHILERQLLPQPQRIGAAGLQEVFEVVLAGNGEVIFVLRKAGDAQ